MTPAPEGLAPLFAAAVRVRRQAVATVLAATLCATVALFLLLSLLPESAVTGRGSPLALLSVLGIVGGLAAAVVLAVRLAGALAPESLAGEADRASGLGQGDVRGALELERAATGSSQSLAALHRERVAAALVAGDALFPGSTSRWRRRFRRAAIAAIGTSLLLAASAALRPGPTARTAEALFSPWSTAFPNPLPPVRLAPGDTAVVRGDRLTVRVVAPGRDEVIVVWQVAGEPAERAVARTGADGRGAVSTSEIRAPTRFWALDGEAPASDTFHVRPLEPLLVEALAVTVEYPGYLERPAERLERPIPPLVLPAGSMVSVEGAANYPLERGELRFLASDGSQDDAVMPLRLDGSRFATRFRPSGAGRWEWDLAAPEAPGEAILPEALHIVVVPDSLPVIQLVYPAGDTIVGPDRVLPLVVDVRDDIALSRVELVTWRSSAVGERSAPAASDLGEDFVGQTRTVLRPLLDLREGGFLPGDTAVYLFRAWDGNRGRGPAVSDTFRARIPSLDELREASAVRSEALADDAHEIGNAAAELEQAAREAERRANRRETQEGPDLGFDATEEGRGVLQQAEELEERLEQLRQEIDALKEDVERSPIGDPRLLEQLERLREQLQELAESGLAEEVEALEQAIRDLDEQAIREALDRLAAEANRIRDEMEQNAGLLERAALEQTLKASRAEAEDLASRQQAAADAAETSEAWAGEEEALASEAERLAAELAELEARLDAAGMDSAADSAAAGAEAASRAAGEMTEAAAQAGQPSGEQAAGAQAQEAAASMEEAASSLAAAESELQQDLQAQAVEAVGRARQEALELAREEARLLDRLQGRESLDGPQWQARQAAIRQGLENLARSLEDAGEKTALLDRETVPMTAAAGERMDAMLKRMSESGGRRKPSSDETARVAESLNDVALRLLASEREIRAAESGSGMQEAVEQMAAMAQQQQGLNQQTTNLMTLGAQGRPVEEEMERIGERQQEISEQLDELATPDEEMLGQPEELANEAEEIAQRLSSGLLDQETLDRQRSLFRRMLDAGRTLEQEDIDRERRESETGGIVEHEIPELDPALLDRTRFPHPSEATMRALPGYYRLMILEYFDRLNDRRPTSRDGIPNDAGAGGENPDREGGGSGGG